MLDDIGRVFRQEWNLEAKPEGCSASAVFDDPLNIAHGGLDFLPADDVVLSARHLAELQQAGQKLELSS